eukprot:gene857-149_t
MAKPCEFADETFEIEEQIIIGVRSSRIRKRTLRDPAYSLKDMLIDESSSYQAKEIESKEEIAETAHQREGTQVTAENGTHQITQNVSHFKKVNIPTTHEISDSDSDTEHEIDYEHNAEHEHGNNREHENAGNARPIRERGAPICHGDPIPSDVL